MLKRIVKYMVQPRVLPLPGWNKKKRHSALSYERHGELLKTIKHNHVDEGHTVNFDNYDDYILANGIDTETITATHKKNVERFHLFCVLAMLLIFVGVSSLVVFGLTWTAALTVSAIPLLALGLSAGWHARLIELKTLPQHYDVLDWLKTRNFPKMDGLK